MAAPLGAILQVVSTGSLGATVASPMWVILIPAFGLIFGIATYGYKLTRVVGTKRARDVELSFLFRILIVLSPFFRPAGSGCAHPVARLCGDLRGRARDARRLAARPAGACSPPIY